MKNYLKWIGITFGGLIILSAVSALALNGTGMKKLNRTYSNIAVEMVNIPTEADAIVRGRHVATIWACTRCHGENMSGMLITNDPLSGIVPIMGTIVAPNLTSGEGGIATSYTDTDWVRAIRHGVMPEGRGEVLMFDYSVMSDQDLGDLIAYLKQLPRVDTNYPEMRYGPLVLIVSAVGLFAPAAEQINHGALHPADAEPGATAEYGEYLSAICTACHGNGVGGTVENWRQEEFVSTFNTGILSNGNRFGRTMSSETFSEMSDTELRALWLYFAGVKS
ncbi:MAG TPA: c-type cytochrome [Candidatus Binatia bacterium]|jgi:mono/diheme cytochrome c family protein|nr:c-type cytochrome [Candidatus Binatia bacterium]